MQYQIRRATAKDAEAVVRMHTLAHEECYGHLLPPAFFEARRASISAGGTTPTLSGQRSTPNRSPGCKQRNRRIGSTLHALSTPTVQLEHSPSRRIPSTNRQGLLMFGVESVKPLSWWGRGYFAMEAVVGLSWWIAVFVSPMVREATLGNLDPVAVAVFDMPLFVMASAVAAFGVRAAAVIATGWTSFVAVALAVYATITTEAGWGVLSMGAATAGSLVALCLILLGRVPITWIIRGPFAFRPAVTRPTAAIHVASTFGQILFFWGFFLAVLPLAIAFLAQRWAVGLPFPSFAGPLGVAVLVLASALGIWSAVVMSTLGDGTPLPSAMPNRLVIAGPYRWIRNPMAVAGIVQGAAIGLILQSWLVIAYAVVGSLVWNYAVRPLEESDLNERFGEEFQQYRDTVRCWIPQVSKSQSSQRFRGRY